MAVTPPKWQFLLTDLAGVVLGELTGASDMSVTLPLNRMPTASCRIPLWSPRVKELLTQDTLLKCYRYDGINTKKLVFFGPVVGVEAQADGTAQTVGISAAGPLWRLTKRLLKGPLVNGDYKTGFSFGAVGGLQEITTIAQNLVNATNGEEFTGIEVRTVTPNSPANMQAVGPWYLKNVAEAISELASGVNSFDFTVEPTEPVMTVGPFPRIGYMDIVPIIGQSRPDAVFEWGAGAANLNAFGWTRSLDGVMTKGFMTAPGWPDGTSKTLIIRENTPARTARGLYEAVISDDGINDDTARTQIIDEHIAVRKQARDIITLTPKANARPAPFTDYVVGDTVRARAVSKGGIVVFDAQFRIWGVTFNVDKNGNETVQLELVMP